MDITADIQQAYVYLLVGNSCMESNNYGRAIESFERANSNGPLQKSIPFVGDLIGKLFNDCIAH